MMIELTVSKNIKLLDFLLGNGINYGKAKSLLKNKDIKINGKRVKENITLISGDTVIIYGYEAEPKKMIKNPIPIVYEDQNIIVINKPAGIQVLKEDAEDNKNCVTDFFDAKPVHRLDRNTQGLLILAKNDMIEQELILAFKNHKIDKYYKVLVFGNIKQNEETMEAYLFKDSRSAISKIYDNYIKGSVKIITEYTVEKRFLDTTLLDVKLVTGKMHQIRAHFAHINHPVVSDSKYCTKNFKYLNEKAHKIFKKQCLCAYRLEFNFEEISPLKYLNKETFEIKCDFVEKIKEMRFSSIE